jgi:hypothetical protein
MLNMCLITCVFLQVNLCLISKMKRARYSRVSHDDEEEKKKRRVHNIIHVFTLLLTCICHMFVRHLTCVSHMFIMLLVSI